MSRRRRIGLPFLVGVALVALFGVRGVRGVIAGVSYANGVRLAAEARYERALPHLERAAVGINRARAIWFQAEVRWGIWYEMPDGEESDEMLRRTYRDYLHVISLSPAGGWYWLNLGDLYLDLEKQEIEQQPAPLDLFGMGPYAPIGAPGRIAIGMYRTSIAREPTEFEGYDRLGKALAQLGLRDQAREPIMQAAGRQPIFYHHSYSELGSVTPDWVLDAFAEGSRAALGETPMVTRATHLTELGKVELRRNNPVQAETDLRAALAESGILLNRAEIHYNLGRALAAQERDDEALEYLLLAEEHENLRIASLRLRAEIHAPRGRLDVALQLIGRLRRLQPREIQHSLEFARIARDLEYWDKAEEAFGWARITHPSDSRALWGLAYLRIDQGDTAGTSRVLDEIERREGLSEELSRIRSELTSLISPEFGGS